MGLFSYMEEEDRQFAFDSIIMEAGILQYNAELDRIEKEYEANIMLSEARVMSIDGSIEDLEYLFEAANTQKQESTDNIIKKLIDVIRNFIRSIREKLFAQKDKDEPADGKIKLVENLAADGKEIGAIGKEIMSAIKSILSGDFATAAIAGNNCITHITNLSLFAENNTTRKAAVAATTAATAAAVIYINRKELLGYRDYAKRVVTFVESKLDQLQSTIIGITPKTSSNTTSTANKTNNSTDKNKTPDNADTSKQTSSNTAQKGQEAPKSEPASSGNAVANAFEKIKTAFLEKLGVFINKLQAFIARCNSYLCEPSTNANNKDNTDTKEKPKNANTEGQSKPKEAAPKDAKGSESTSKASADDKLKIISELSAKAAAEQDPAKRAEYLKTIETLSDEVGTNTNESVDINFVDDPIGYIMNIMEEGDI